METPARELNDSRASWKRMRREMEEGGLKRHPRRKTAFRNLRKNTFAWVRFVLRWTLAERLTSRLARNVRLVRREFVFPDLPEAFDGYRILHLTDPHFDRLPGLERNIVEALPAQTPDLVIWTGDYNDNFFVPAERTVRCLATVTEALNPVDGTVAVLGNHDTWKLVEPMERAGIRVLTNQTWILQRGASRICVAGLDDVHNFFTPMAWECLRAAPDLFRIALVHSSEAVREAEAAGFHFYLCGHTHGGQICLPGGIPVFTHTDQPRSLARGPWRVGALQGLTSPGCGVVSLPVRLFCPPEITEIILKKC